MPATGVPRQDGFFGIRLESIGGLGAHLAGQMLAEAIVLRQGLNATHFSSYGSEKKGTPVKSFVRIAPDGGPIRTSSPVEEPQVVAVFHEALVDAGDVLAGLPSDGTAIVATAAAPAELRARLGLATGTVGALDAQQIAIEEKTRVNTALMGAVARACPVLDPDAVRETIRATFSRRHPEVVDANVRTFDRGYEELRTDTVAAPAGAPGRPVARAAPAFGYLDAPLGGVLLEPGNSVAKDMSTSREGFLPELVLDDCVHCGLCDVVCPDLCLVWEPIPDGVRLRGIDYRYCKGCLKCVDACPTGAIRERREEPGWADANRTPLFAEVA
ncbi:MAG TPA: 2-oxoacid:acceptor oxidoreductase family protein [Gaiellaceae bacterium]|nr:2-oxoacid:acceptor oxidoreductase family protein [Gaiellaceae bacterium]